MYCAPALEFFSNQLNISLTTSPFKDKDSPENVAHSCHAIYGRCFSWNAISSELGVTNMKPDIQFDIHLQYRTTTLKIRHD